MIEIVIRIDDEHEFMQCSACFPKNGTPPNQFEEVMGRAVLEFVMKQANKRYPDVGACLVERDLPKAQP